MANVVDETRFRIAGSVTLHDVTQDYRVIAHTKNLVVDLSYTELLPRIIGRDANAAVGIIAIGDGGEYDQAGVFHGVRQAPLGSDTRMRLEIFRAAIVRVNFPAANEVEFLGLIRENEAVSTNIDEFGLLTMDGRMIAHAVNAESGPSPSATVKYTKPLGAIYQVSWKLIFTACP